MQNGRKERGSYSRKRRRWKRREDSLMCVGLVRLDRDWGGGGKVTGKVTMIYLITDPSEAAAVLTNSL